MTRILIRDFTFPDDYPFVLDLWEKAGAGVHVGSSDTPDEIVKKLERDPDLFLVAECDDTLVGSVIGGFDGRRGLIYHLAVNSNFRRRGVGTELMAEVEKRLKDKGCIKCYLLVAGENLAAMRFYEDSGWSNMDNIRLYGKTL